MHDHDGIFHFKSTHLQTQTDKKKRLMKTDWMKGDETVMSVTCMLGKKRIRDRSISIRTDNDSMTEYKLKYDSWVTTSMSRSGKCTRRATTSMLEKNVSVSVRARVGMKRCGSGQWMSTQWHPITNVRDAHPPREGARRACDFVNGKTATQFGGFWLHNQKTRHSCHGHYSFISWHTSLY